MSSLTTYRAPLTTSQVQSGITGEATVDRGCGKPACSAQNGIPFLRQPIRTARRNTSGHKQMHGIWLRPSVPQGEREKSAGEVSDAFSMAIPSARKLQ